MMDSRMRHELDRHIMGEDQYRKEDVEHICPKCGNKWSTIMVFDMGEWTYDAEDEVFCPKCDTEGKIRE